VIPVTSKGRTIDQISHRLMRNALRGFLLQAMRARPGAVEGISSIGCQASAVLYTLLLDHPIDRRGRCPSCRGFGAVIGVGLPGALGRRSGLRAGGGADHVVVRDHPVPESYTPEAAAEAMVQRLAAGVAPGGTLFMVGHRPIDPTTGGKTYRLSLSGDYQQDLGGAEFQANVYAVKYKLNLGSRYGVDPALDKGHIHLYPRYAHTAATFLMGTAPTHPVATVAAFNERALAACWKAGLLPVRSFNRR